MMNIFEPPLAQYHCVFEQEQDVVPSPNPTKRSSQNAIMFASRPV
jgi:hypothetical protein